MNVHWDELREQPNSELDDQLDCVAQLVSSDGAFVELQRSFQDDPGLHPPASLLS